MAEQPIAAAVAAAVLMRVRFTICSFLCDRSVRSRWSERAASRLQAAFSLVTTDSGVVRSPPLAQELRRGVPNPRAVGGRSRRTAAPARREAAAGRARRAPAAAEPGR